MPSYLLSEWRLCILFVWLGYQAMSIVWWHWKRLWNIGWTRYFFNVQSCIHKLLKQMRKWNLNRASSVPCYVLLSLVDKHQPLSFGIPWWNGWSLFIVFAILGKPERTRLFCICFGQFQILELVSKNESKQI